MRLAHSHFWQRGFPGQASDKSVNEWSEAIYRPAMNLTTNDMYNLTMQGATSHLQKGITTAFNFAYSPMFRDGLADRAQFTAALESGIRFVHGFNVGALTPQWCQDQALARTQSFLKWASFRWQWLKNAGLLNERPILGHFLHPTPSMLKEAAQAGMRMSWNPMSNGRLGSGIADIPEYLRSGLGIGLGVDGEASSDRCDPFENMRMGLYSIRGKNKDPSILTTREVLYMHTLGAAQTLGIADKVGSLEVGKQADIVLLDPPVTWTLDDPVSTLVLSAGVENIHAVFVGGAEQWPRRPSAAESAYNSSWQVWTFPSN
ncbi:hypothetical protein AbraCBS73388_011670 [Aspergillus brasiliensis]|uniref:Amidohydrolase-related domain-containing protein n=1 Tax=Aspergillus brasiliensis TaxID=319629 RepID=A0A9W6DPC8_9EURO|nr:hypothetical protein AbraCBS73388_011670 [Aspergillus brasiliensis]